MARTRLFTREISRSLAAPFTESGCVRYTQNSANLPQKLRNSGCGTSMVSARSAQGCEISNNEGCEFLEGSSPPRPRL